MSIAPNRPAPTPAGACGHAVADQVQRRAAALAALYRHIAATRMADVPMLHPGLRVETVGFEPEPGARGASGVLVTPWFMNLVWLPLDGGAAASGEDDGPVQPPLGLGCTRERRIGHTAFPFIGAGEEPIGPFETCSLFSPMFEFEDHAAAVATATAVLHHLRTPVDATADATAGAAPTTAPTSAPASPARGPDDPMAPSRRRLLFGGRSSASARTTR